MCRKAGVWWDYVEMFLDFVFTNCIFNVVVFFWDRPFLCHYFGNISFIDFEDKILWVWLAPLQALFRVASIPLCRKYLADIV